MRKGTGIVGWICFATATLVGAAVCGVFFFIVATHGLSVAVSRFNANLSSYLYAALVPILVAFGLYVRKPGPHSVKFTEEGFQLDWPDGRAREIKWTNTRPILRIVRFNVTRGEILHRDHPPGDGRLISYVDLGMLRFVALSDLACDHLLEQARAHGLLTTIVSEDRPNSPGMVYKILKPR